MRILKLLLLISLLAIPIFAAKYKTSQELVTAMQKKYAKNWYKTLTFLQKVTQYKADGTTQNSVWYEAMNGPGQLRIDFDPLDKGDGMIFTNGMQHLFKDGKLTKSQPLVHSLMVLGFDVYVQPVEKTLSQLNELKVDMSLLREDNYQGRPVYVLGAKEGDLHSLQFWIDKEHLYFVRMFQPAGKDKTSTNEVQFNKYQQLKGGGWIAPEVIFKLDGKTYFVEEYYDIQTGVPLNQDLYNPEKWMTVDRTYYKKKE